MSMSYQDLLRQLQAQQQQAPPAPPPPPQPPDDPILGGLRNVMNAPVLGGALQGATGALGAVANAPVIGGALNAISYPGQVLRGIGLHDQLAGDVSGFTPSMDTLQSILQGVGRLGSDTLQHGPLGALGAAHDRWEELPMSGAKLLDDVLLDPTNLIGAGAAGKAATLTKSDVLRQALLKADAAEKGAQQAVKTGLGVAGDAASTAAHAGLDAAGAIHPWFKTALDQSPRAAVALENDRGVNLFGHISNFMGTDTGGRLFADLARDPADPRYASAAAGVSGRLQDLLGAAGSAGAHNLDPADVVATFQSLLPGFEPGHAQALGQELPKLFDRYDRDQGLVQQVVGQVYAGHGVQPQSVEEAIAFAERQGLTTDADLLRKVQSQWKGTDLLRADEDTAVMGRYLRKYAHDQGMHPEDMTGFQKAYQEGQTAWRQQALFWPSYWINNGKDIVFKSMAEMGHPGISDLGHNTLGVAGKFIEEEQPRWQQLLQDHPGLQPVADTLGKALPYQRAVDAAHTMGPVWGSFADQVGLKKPPAEILQGGLSNELGGIKGVGGREAQGLERVPGLGRVVEGFRETSEALETSARSAAFMDGYLKHMQGMADHTASRLEQVAADGGLPQSAQKLVSDSVYAADGVVSPQRAAEILSAAGADDATVAAAMREMGGVQTGAYRAGVDQTHGIHFDYRQTTNLDEAARNVLGFHFWATRNVPKYMEIMGTHPGLWAALDRMDQGSEDYLDQNNLHSPSLQNKVSLGGVGRALAGALFGRQGDLFVDPSRLVGIESPTAEMRQPSKGETGLGQVLDAAASVGVSPNPLIQQGLSSLGVYGARQPASVLRPTPMVNSLVEQATGQQFDLEGPLHAAGRQRPLNALGANQPVPTDPEDMVKWRLRELAQENPSRAREFRTATPGTPAWSEAIRSLGSQSARERTLSAMGVTAKFYSDAQQALDQRRKTA